MAVWEGKKYKMEKSENFDEYMKALGEINFVQFVCVHHQFFIALKSICAVRPCATGTPNEGSYDNSNRIRMRFII